MNNDLRYHVYENFSFKETDEIIKIWTTNDRVEWTDLAFDVMREILEQRLEMIPPQNIAILEHVKNKDYVDEDEYCSEELYIKAVTKPVFYKPKIVIWVKLWLNRIAIAMLLLTGLFNLAKLPYIQQIVFSIFGNNMTYEILSWIITLVIGIPVISLYCLVIFFALRALAAVLGILMEMEFQSRAGDTKTI